MVSTIPLLFLLYIIDLKTVVTNDVDVALSADDVSLFCNHPCKLTAQAAMHEAVTRVSEWSRHHNITLNTEKCEVTLFTINLQPTNHLEGQPLRVTPQAKLLGVTLDHTHPFGQPS